MATRLSSGARRLNLALWIAQCLLAFVFGAAGLAMLFTPLSDLPTAISPGWLIRFIGVAELAGALGVVVPALTRIMPMLTPLAAAGFAMIQVLAIIYHADMGETAQTLPLNLALLGLSLFVVWGRWLAVPIPAPAIAGTSQPGGA